MNLDDMFPRKYANGEDLKGQAHTLTIARVVIEKMHVGDRGKEEDRFIIYFDGAQKGIILSKTLAVQIAAIVGDKETNHWVGKRVTIYPERMMVGGTERFAVRARKPVETQAPAAEKKEDDERA